jgi:tRNA(fMet)-specific endonuclease VapC
MVAYLLDTNHTSPLVMLQHPLRQRVLITLAAGDMFAICVPVLTETLFGIGIAPRAIHNLAVWEQLRMKIPCYVPDEDDAIRATNLQIQLRKRGRQITTVDATIAVTALRYDLTLLTTDGDFRAVPGLRLDNWL